MAHDRSAQQAPQAPNDDAPPEQQSRLRVLIYPKFQLIMVAVNAIIMIFMVGFISYQMSASFDKFEEVGRLAQWPRTHDYYRFLSYQEDVFYSNITWALLMGFALSTICTLLLSHQMAGPILRLRRYFKQIILNGRNAPIEPLSFRKNDFFSDLPPVINDAIDELKGASKKDAA